MAEHSTLYEHPDAHDIDDNTEQDAYVIVVTQTEEGEVTFDELSVEQIAFGSATVSITENTSVLAGVASAAGAIVSTRVVAGRV
jgi:hypothetical protein